MDAIFCASISWEPLDNVLLHEVKIGVHKGLRNRDMALASTSGDLSDLPNSTPVKPPVTEFFGLTELEEFVRVSIDPEMAVEASSILILDFSAVREWDIAALLWLVVGLHYYKRQGRRPFLLRLPQADGSLSQSERDLRDRSADYLRRWRFDRALRNIDPEVANLLVPEQRDFFNPVQPKRYYLSPSEHPEQRLLQSLISRNLAEIRDVSDPRVTGATPISAKRITQCIRDFQGERIGDILVARCHIEKRKADLVSDHLLTEALLNVQEHPNASLGMVAISVSSSSEELILSVVDNGESIPKTIYERFASDKKSEELPIDYDRESTNREMRTEIADYATKEGVTRKKGSEAANAGMGLTYIKNDSVNTFAGTLTLVTDHLRMKYSGGNGVAPEVLDWKHPWQGNLLRIAIPVSCVY